MIIANRKFTTNLEEGEEYFGISKGNNFRFELGASLTGFYKFELIENVILEQRLSLYSDYLQNAENIDVDYARSAYMKGVKSNFNSTRAILHAVWTMIMQ